MTATVAQLQAATERVSIDRLFPEATSGVSDDELLDSYASVTCHDRDTPWVRLNFVASIDGSATRDGLSGALGTSADSRLFDLLRRSAQVVLVGAGTVRAEGYGPMILSQQDVAWRRARGLFDHPVLAVVSGRLDLDPTSPIFTNAPVRPLIYTTKRSATSADELHRGADVVATGDQIVDLIGVIEDLKARGLMTIHCEGGPTLAGQLLARDRVNEICLTLSPQAVGGPGGRITSNPIPSPKDFQLAALHHSESTLLARFVQSDPTSRR